MANVKEWAVLVYMAADVPAQAMRSAAKRNLKQMANVGSSESVWIAAQIDLTGEPTRRYVFPPKPKDTDHWVAKPQSSQLNVNSADTDSIEAFFKWATGECPAKNILLALYGHGYGLDDWNPLLPDSSEMPFLSPALPGSNYQALAQKLPFTLEEGLDRSIRATALPGIDDTYTLILDHTSKAALKNYQVADVLRRCRQTLPPGQNLSILGFDCCEMAMAEVMCEMQGCTDLAIASQSGIPYTSWPYDLFLSELLQKPQSTPEDVSRLLVNAFQDFYRQRHNVYVTLSACDLRLCSNLETAVAALAKALSDVSDDEKARQIIFNARNDSPLFDPDGFIDLDCFCGFLHLDMPNSPVGAASQAVRDILKTFVIAAGWAPDDPQRMISLSKGLSVWFPPWIQDPSVNIPEKQQSEDYLRGGYPLTVFGRSTKWDSFLVKLQDSVSHRSELEETMANEQNDLTQNVEGKTPDQGRTPDQGKGDVQGKTPDQGRGAVLGKTPDQGRIVFSEASIREAGVIVRATVEAFGPVGDTELNITVKWPAATIGALPTNGQNSAGPVVGSTPTQGPTSHDTGNLHQKVSRTS